MDILYRLPQVIKYQNEKAVQYAHRWAYARNTSYFDFENYGGDCTNFVSQAIYAASGIMNYNKNTGWYYSNSYNRAPTWTSVNLLHDFLVSNKGPGPFAKEVDMKDLQPGDLTQLSFSGGGVFNHSQLIVKVGSPASNENILVATHTDDQDYYALTNFDYVDIRYIHIVGVRAW